MSNQMTSIFFLFQVHHEQSHAQKNIAILINIYNKFNLLPCPEPLLVSASMVPGKALQMNGNWIHDIPDLNSL